MLTELTTSRTLKVIAHSRHSLIPGPLANVALSKAELHALSFASATSHERRADSGSADSLRLQVNG
jgi:hypothetical protein